MRFGLQVNHGKNNWVRNGYFFIRKTVPGSSSPWSIGWSVRGRVVAGGAGVGTKKERFYRKDQLLALNETFSRVERWVKKWEGNIFEVLSTVRNKRRRKRQEGMMWFKNNEVEEPRNKRKREWRNEAEKN